MARLGRWDCHDGRVSGCCLSYLSPSCSECEPVELMCAFDGPHSDFVICWPNSDGSWTLSHRTAPSTVLPTLVGSANSKDPSVDSTGSLRIVPSLSSKSASEAPAVVTWERPLKLPTGYKGKGSAFQLQKAINQVRLREAVE